MFDKILSKFGLADDDYDDDYYDDEESYDDEDDYDDDRKKGARSGIFGNRQEAEPEEDKKPVATRTLARKDKVVPLERRTGRGMEVCVIKPTSIEDAKEITDTLLEGKAVVLNLDGIESKVAQRLIDFAAGSSYAIDGNLQMITSTMIIITPHNVNVTGDLSDIVNKDINLSTIEDTTLTAHSLDF